MLQCQHFLWFLHFHTWKSAQQDFGPRSRFPVLVQIRIKLLLKWTLKTHQILTCLSHFHFDSNVILCVEWNHWFASTCTFFTAPCCLLLSPEFRGIPGKLFLGRKTDLSNLSLSSLLGQGHLQIPRESREIIKKMPAKKEKGSKIP